MINVIRVHTYINLRLFPGEVDRDYRISTVLTQFSAYTSVMYNIRICTYNPCKLTTEHGCPLNEGGCYVMYSINVWLLQNPYQCTSGWQAACGRWSACLTPATGSCSEKTVRSSSNKKRAENKLSCIISSWAFHFWGSEWIYLFCLLEREAHFSIIMYNLVLFENLFGSSTYCNFMLGLVAQLKVTNNFWFKNKFILKNKHDFCKTM